MNKEELKKEHSMLSVVERYGLKVNRAGFVACPFHNEKTASMKIYKDSYHCFGCGTSGDIFSFVMHMEHCGFKTAFMILGGTYEEPTFQSKLAIYRHKKEQADREARQLKLKKEKEMNFTLIGIYRHYLDKLSPYGESWTECYNALQYQLYLMDVLNTRGEDYVRD